MSVGVSSIRRSVVYFAVVRCGSRGARVRDHGSSALVESQ